LIENKPTPSADDIRALIRYLPILEATNFSAGEMVCKDGHFPFAVLSANASRFVRELHERGFVYAFEWPAWADEAQRYFNQHALLEEASLDTIRRLFFVLVRQERFCEGTLLDAFQSGLMVALLRRLERLPEAPT
jgi:hypothetical protein